VLLLGGFGVKVTAGSDDDVALGRLLSHIDLGDGRNQYGDVLNVSDLVELLGGFGNPNGLLSDLVDLVGGFGPTVDVTDLVDLLVGFGDENSLIDDLVMLVGGFGVQFKSGTGNDVALGRLLSNIDLGGGNDQYGDVL